MALIMAVKTVPIMVALWKFRSLFFDHFVENPVMIFRDRVGCDGAG